MILSISREENSSDVSSSSFRAPRTGGSLNDPSLTRLPSLFPLQVHGYPGLPGDVRQHSRAGQQAAPAVPPAPEGDAGHRVRDKRLDFRVPAPVPQPPVELQHHSQGPQPVRAPAVTQ